MRILASADVHGVNGVYEWLVELGRNCAVDAVVLAGDLLPPGFPEEQREAAATIAQTLRRIGAPVLYIMGNDDNVELGADDNRLIPIHGRAVEVCGYKFVGYQYTPPFVGDAFVKPEEEIASDLLTFESLLDGRTIFVTHTPAWAWLDESFGENAGSRAVRALLGRRPVLAHIHGHIHGRFGRAGNHFNAACGGMCRATLIELPGLRHAVVAHNAGLLPWVMFRAAAGAS